MTVQEEVQKRDVLKELIRDIHMLVQIDVGFIKETQLKAISL